MSRETEARECFPVCPLCGKESITIKIARSFGKDTMTCTNCGAKWHLHYRDALISGFDWATLKIEAEDGTGNDLLQKRIGKNQWEKLAREARNREKASRQSSSTPSASSVVKEKEIIKETQVIIKIRCPYCSQLYAETLDKCPNCGGHT